MLRNKAVHNLASGSPKMADDQLAIAVVGLLTVIYGSNP